MQQPNPDLTYLLPRHLYYHVVHALRAALPPPAIDDPDDLARRDHAAISQVASLLPANGEEVVLAAQYVAANAQALDCLRLVRNIPADTATGLKCVAQSASMMRQARAARALLMKVQAQRQKREADDAARDNAAMIEYCATGLMQDALISGDGVTNSLHRPAPPPDGAHSDPFPAQPVEPISASLDTPAAREPFATRLPDQPPGRSKRYSRQRASVTPGQSQPRPVPCHDTGRGPAATLGNCDGPRVTPIPASHTAETPVAIAVKLHPIRGPNVLAVKQRGENVVAVLR